MSEQSNTETVSKLYSCFLEGDMEGATNQFSEDAVIEFSFEAGAMPYPNRYVGHDGFRELLDVIEKYYEIESLEIRETIAQDDFVSGNRVGENKSLSLLAR